MQKRGNLYDVQLKTSSLTGQHLGWATIKFTNPEAAQTAVRMSKREKIRGGQFLQVFIPSLRLLLHNIPQSKSIEQIEQEIKKATGGITIIYSSNFGPLLIIFCLWFSASLVKAYISPGVDGQLNSGYCLLEFQSEADVNLAKQTFALGRVRIFGFQISPYSENIQELQPDDETVPQVKIYYSFYFKRF